MKTILLASVLKPVDDTRMYGKFARTLVGQPDVSVHVAGRSGPGHLPAPSGAIQQHSLFCGSRLSWARVRAQARYWDLLRRLHPTLVVVHAPELLPLTVLWQALGRKRQFLYDVRENYALNIRTQGVYPAWLRRFLAATVRGLENLAAARAAGVLLAEKSYAEELPFATPAHTLVLENKYQPAPSTVPAIAPRPWQPGQPLELLYSGTISELNGALDAIALAKALYQVWPQVRLTIIGFCQQPAFLLRLQQAIAEASDFVTLIGGAQPVPHAQILTTITRSHVGLLPYQEHPSTWRCIPTKLFEYLANGLPVLLPPNPAWVALVRQHHAGLTIDFRDLSPASMRMLATRLQAGGFYPHGIPQEVFWDGEGQKLVSLLDSIW
ncbi:glycosyltransferase family 4 protein [Hymenobacter lutimineralis]|uniref:Glycosyltransferase family 4 protein n=1 Tax=Hymenobacter lutimineralis TaxID=2606448 RepID=A0A5D6UTT5_9BACT|nr:glycosyltransferase family 4 protein [Hymenobacter lutimineralis]TYZ06338.1 glycosyltransferase family 4 protein [Hymenobacter lutimineralis]